MPKLKKFSEWSISAKFQSVLFVLVVTVVLSSIIYGRLCGHYSPGTFGISREQFFPRAALFSGMSLLAASFLMRKRAAMYGFVKRMETISSSAKIGRFFGFLYVGLGLLLAFTLLIYGQEGFRDVVGAGAMIVLFTSPFLLPTLIIVGLQLIKDARVVHEEVYQTLELMERNRWGLRYYDPLHKLSVVMMIYGLLLLIIALLLMFMSESPCLT